MNQIPNRSPYGITPGNPIQGFYSTGVCRLLSLALSSVLRANTKNIIVLEPPSTLPPPAMQTPPPRKKGSLLSVVYWGSAGANINRFFFLKDFQMASVFPCVLWNFKKNLYGKGLFLFSSVTLWYCPEFFDVEFRKSYPPSFASFIAQVQGHLRAAFPDHLGGSCHPSSCHPPVLFPSRCLSWFDVMVLTAGHLFIYLLL